jgi:hypothetical protein
VNEVNASSLFQVATALSDSTVKASNAGVGQEGGAHVALDVLVRNSPADGAPPLYISVPDGSLI